MKYLAITVILIAALSFGIPTAYASASSPSVHLRISTYSNPGLTMPSSKVHPGGSLYVVVSLVDKAGKPVVWTLSKPLLITLSVSGGVLTATDVFITAGNSNTSASFGLILYTAPTSHGIKHLTASATISGAVQTTTKKIHVLPH
jgi:hypothetical protein